MPVDARKIVKFAQKIGARDSLNRISHGFGG